MQRSTILPQTLPLPRGLTALLALLLVGGTLAAGYRETLTPVTLVVDGHQRRVYTHQETVGALLLDRGLALRSEDVVEPPLDTPLDAAGVVTVRRARPVLVVADGHRALFYTHATSVGDVLREARVSLGPHDEAELEGQLAAPSSDPADPEPARVTVQRAVPFTLAEDGQSTTLHTTAPTVGQALLRAGITLYLADHVEPPLAAPMSAGLRVSIERSVPVTVEVDGRTLRTRTHRERVDEVLADLGIVLTGQDYTDPALDAALEEGATIRVVRVAERFRIEQEPIPFQVVWQPDPDLEIDNQRLLQEGARGVLQRRIRLRYENGQEVARTTEDEYVALPPTTKVMGYGTKIVVRTLSTPSGPVEYWRKIHMLATSYSASTAGTPPTSPWYGWTRTGLRMRHGIVAVDPDVISLHSQVYVPGYGVGYAGDTGGWINGRRIDLGYDDDNLVLWYQWVDVYVLTPVPPADEINYVIGQ